MRVWEREADGYSIVGRPTAWRIRQPMKNGQWLTVFFRRKRVKGDTKEEIKAWGDIRYVWDVAIHVGKTKRQANRWYHGWSKKDHNRSTGDGSLAALSQALAYIRAFVVGYMGKRDELQIYWSDERRARAYRYLLRYPGFFIDKDRPNAITAWNPSIYEFTGERGVGVNGRNEHRTENISAAAPG